MLAGPPGGPWPIQSRKMLMSSQAPRTPMLLFEFVGELFQFEQREPELEPLFQLPPRITANLPALPLPVFDPTPKDCTHLGQHDLRRLQLVRTQASYLHKKPHPKTQSRQSRVGHVNSPDLI